jgi:secreted trypsin-like serine protease
MRPFPARRWFAALAGLAAAVVAVTVAAAPANAITNGELDGDAHPYVGLMVAKDADGNPLWRCSGSLLSPTVYLTAGHCTQAPAVSADIWFGPDLRDAAAIDFPAHGDGRGATFTHPDFDPAAPQVRDVGVVVLDEPVSMPRYAQLPQLDQFESFTSKRGQQDLTFTAVGYGVQRMFPEAASWKIESQRLRMVAQPRLVQIDTAVTGDHSIMFSGNANTGGTCRGDSGGPFLVGDSDVVGAVNSFTRNDVCAGNTGAFRMDRSWALEWVGGFLAAE